MHTAEILKQLISFPTITPKEFGLYGWIEEFLGKDFVYERFDCGEVKNLFAFRDFNPSSEEKKLHFCFSGHIDVVPAGDHWQSDAFKPRISEGYLYGRGAQDMKGGIACFLNALKQLDFQVCNVVFSILLTSDEEGKAVDGTRFVLDTLQKRNFLPDLALVAEPTSENRIADIVKVGRRGSINGTLILNGIGGHVAYPQKCLNPIEALGERLGKIAGVYLDSGDEYFAPSQIIVTDIRGGMELCNVTPSDLKLMFNVRNSTMSDEKKLQDYLENVLEGLSYQLELQTSSKPFLTQSVFFPLLARSVQNITGYAPNPSTSGGTSDARYFASFGVDVLELGVLNDRIHAADERVKIQDLETLKEVFSDFLSTLMRRNDERSQN